MAKEGYTVAINGRREDEGAKRIAEMEAEGLKAEFYPFE